MGSERLLMLRAICEAPRDDLPRLVYCDWLEENGEVDRAAYIRYSLVHRETMAFASGTEARICGMQSSTGFQIAPLIPNVSWTLRRGFVESVHCRFRNFDPHWFDTMPIQNVVIWTDHTRIIDMWHMPEALRQAVTAYATTGPYANAIVPDGTRWVQHWKMLRTTDANAAIRIVSHAIVNYAREQVGLPCIWKSNQKVINTELPREQQTVNSLSSASNLLADVPLSPSESANH